MIPGIDVSTYQGVMNWQKAATKAQFAIIRAGSINAVTGVCYEDYQWQNNKKAPAVLPSGFYWYFRPALSAAKQAAYFLNLVRPIIQVGGKFTYPALWCDLEEPGAAAVVKTFCDLVQKEFAIGIYTSVGKMGGITGIKTVLKDYPLWMADWTPPYPIPAPWTDYLILQYGKYKPASDYGAGAGTEIDVDTAKDALLPVAPPPPSNLEARIRALEADMQVAFNRIVALENKPAGISAPFKMLARTPARCITSYNDAGKPVFQIYPKDTSETSERIYLEGTIQVFPYAMIGDGGRKAYPVYRTAPQQLYVFADDGALMP